MKIPIAHVRERAQAGGWIDFVVFDARSMSGSKSDNANLLARLTARARGSGLKVDQAALAFSENGSIQFFGLKPLVEYLSQSGVPQWTHTIDV